MEIFRIPPYPIIVQFDSLSVTTEYVLRLYDRGSGLFAMTSATSDGSGDISFTLPESVSNYDSQFQAIVYQGTISEDLVVWTYGDLDSYFAGEDYDVLDNEPPPYDKQLVIITTNLSIVRPYLIPADIAPVVGDIPNYTKYERFARMQIDSIVGGFYFKQKVLDLQGMGNDKLTIGQRINDIVSVMRNNVMVYDRDAVENEEEYSLTADYQSMLRRVYDEVNIIESKNPRFSFWSTFPLGWDFKVRIETGWLYVPQDIQDATLLLIEDMACMTPNYLNKYVREYETKDFRVDIHRPAFAGTGNLMVDQVLQKYIGDTLYDNVRVL
jgi:hypothetical protein